MRPSPTSPAAPTQPDLAGRTYAACAAQPNLRGPTWPVAPTRPDLAGRTYSGIWNSWPQMLGSVDRVGV